MRKRFIYLIQNEDDLYIKIGIGVKPKTRVKTLTTGSTANLKIIYQKEVDFAPKIETCLHRIFASKRRKGEWFDLSEDDIEMIDKEIVLCEKNFLFLEEQGNPFIK